MWTLLLTSIALAANLVIDAKVPVEVWLAGELAAQVVLPCEVHFALPPGPLELNLVIAGRNQPHRVEIPQEGATRVVVGRTGVTTAEDLALALPVDGAEAGVPAEVPAVFSLQFRSAAREDLVVVLAGKRFALSPRQVHAIEVTPGRHTLSIRNPNGTVVWAQGKLEVEADGVIVQVTDGRMPEVSGAGGSFHPDHR